MNLDSDLEIITAWKDRIRSEMRDFITLLENASRSGKPPREDTGIIYQYTTASGLRGMIESASVWSTPVGYLNDASEYRYGRELVSKVILSTDEGTDDLSHNDRKALRPFFEHLDATEANDVFVTCFTRRGDQLGQWRGYAADGYGYAIGFEEIRIREMQPRMAIVDVLYRESRQRAVLMDFFQKINEFWTSKSPDNPEYKTLNMSLDNYQDGDPIFDTLAGIMFALTIRTMLPMFKDKGFAEEREVRAFLITDFYPGCTSNLKYHEHKGILVPHIPITWESGKLPIKEIIIGPNLNFEKAKWSMSHFLTQHGYPNVEIKRSSVPYLA